MGEGTLPCSLSHWERAGVRGHGHVSSSKSDPSISDRRYQQAAEKACGPWFDRLTMRCNLLILQHLILSLSKDELVEG
jgi:hypothetical protein